MHAAAHCGRFEARGQRAGGKQARYEANEMAYKSLQHKSSQIKVGDIQLTEQAFRVFIHSPLSMAILQYSIQKAQANITQSMEEVRGGAWHTPCSNVLTVLCARYTCVAAGTPAGLRKYLDHTYRLSLSFIGKQAHSLLGSAADPKLERTAAAKVGRQAIVVTYDYA